MPTIYLKHPKHGVKAVVFEAEAVHDEKSGWVRYNPPTPSIPEWAAPRNNALKVGRKLMREGVPE